MSARPPAKPSLKPRGDAFRRQIRAADRIPPVINRGFHRLAFHHVIGDLIDGGMDDMVYPFSLFTIGSFFVGTQVNDKYADCDRPQELR